MNLQENIQRIKQMMGLKEQKIDISEPSDKTFVNLNIPKISVGVENDVEKEEEVPIQKEEIFKLLSSLDKKGRGPKSHYAQVKGTKMDNWQSRNAYDLMCQPGTEVRSPVNGTISSYSISSSKNPYVYGVNITISTENGNDKIFMTHLDPNTSKVDQGQKVNKGDILGKIGDPIAAGKSFASHLHVSTFDESHNIFNYINDDMTIK